MSEPAERRSPGFFRRPKVRRILSRVEHENLTVVGNSVGPPSVVAFACFNTNASDRMQELGDAFSSRPEEQDPRRTLLEEKFADRNELAKDRLLQPAGQFLH